MTCPRGILYLSTAMKMTYDNRIGRADGDDLLPVLSLLIFYRNTYLYIETYLNLYKTILIVEILTHTFIYSA